MKPAKPSELIEAIIRASGRDVRNKSRDTDKRPVPAAEPSANASLRVLLVEDGKANQLLAQRILQKWGHQVEIAENGQEAVDRWQNGSFDLILMDVQMPVMDGFEATRRIRELEASQGIRIPIVAMTAHAMKGDRDRCIESGMDAYIAKPFRQHELNRVLSGLAVETRP